MLVLVMLAAVPTAAFDTEIASYDIDVTLDAATHSLEGAETVRWRNTTAVATSELWFHLYLNAFAGSESTFMREIRSDPMAEERVDTGRGWGWTRITRMTLADGTGLLTGMTFERPDDGNEADHTVVRVVLPHAVAPGEVVELELEFEAVLPRAVARTGHVGEFHMVAQWFPKLGVFEGPEGWNCHQFHATSEFFADFGTYRVRMTVPRDWVVGATGELLSRESAGAGDVLEYQAVGVHDFAFAAAPPDLMTAVEVEFDPGRHVPQAWLERAVDVLGLGAAELELPPMTIRLLAPRSQEVLIPRMLRAARLAVAWYGLHLGPYPYPQLTVVSPPPGARATGGMEYPTLITTGASRLDASPLFSWRSDIETVTIHEIGHQYFQGLLASNEFEAAWLDEGLTTWAENHCLDDVVADGLAPEIRFAPTWGRERLVTGFADLPLTIDRPTWEHRRLMDSFLAAYSKTAVAMRTLEGLLGKDRVVRAVRAYVEAHRYDHPDGYDLQTAIEQATGEDLQWFFDGVIRGDLRPDWAVMSVRHHRVEAPAGLQWRQGAWREPDGEETPDGRDEGPWRIVVEIGRRGELRGPVDVELVWADGRSERLRWDGAERWRRWELESEVRLRSVVVDPEGVWALETRRADNYWRDEPRGLGPLWWFDDAVRLIGLLTVPWG